MGMFGCWLFVGCFGVAGMFAGCGVDGNLVCVI